MENHRSIWDTKQGVVSKCGKRYLPVWSYKLWVEVNICILTWCILTSVCFLVRDQTKMLSEKYLHMGTEPKSQRVISKHYIHLKGCGMCDLVIPPVWSIFFFYTKTCFKGRKYFKDLCRSEMTANSQWVKFSALAMFSLYIRDMLMGQELLSGQLAKAAGLCAALLAVVLWGQGRCAIYSLEWDNESEAAWKKLMQFSVRTYFLIQKVLAKSSGIWPWLPL